MKKNEKSLDVVFLLDRSGSMQGMEKDTIGGYNSYLETIKDKNVKVTTVLFDDRYELLYERKDVKEVKALTKKEYFVRGCTALLDAIGKSIKYIEGKSKEKVLFVITIDGLENASHEFNKDQIKEMICAHKDWDFIYIGADIDSFNEARNIGISDANIANYSKDEKGIKKLFKSIAKASEMVYKESLMEDWKSDLDEYINKNS